MHEAYKQFVPIAVFAGACHTLGCGVMKSHNLIHGVVCEGLVGKGKLVLLANHFVWLRALPLKWTTFSDLSRLALKCKTNL